MTHYTALRREEPVTASGLTEQFTPLSMDAMIAKYNLAKKKVYYVGTDKRGRLFGIEGNSQVFLVPEILFVEMGWPEEGADISGRKLLSNYKKIFGAARR